MSHWIPEATKAFFYLKTGGFPSHLKSINQIWMSSLSSYSSAKTSVSNGESRPNSRAWLCRKSEQIFSWFFFHIVGIYCSLLTLTCQILKPGNAPGRSTFLPTGPMSSLFIFVLLPLVLPICPYLSWAQGQVWENWSRQKRSWKVENSSGFFYKITQWGQ